MKKNSNTDWINRLNVGDRVVVSTTDYGKSSSTVARTTKAQIILADGSRFWKRNGRAVGLADRWLNKA